MSKIQVSTCIILAIFGSHLILESSDFGYRNSLPKPLCFLFLLLQSTLFLYNRKLPVKSLTPGLKTVSANKFAPRETNLRFRSQP